MAEYDGSRGTLTTKVVYYGPALSGKTTNIIRLHDFLAPEMKGELMTMDTRNDRTLFFDLLPLGFRAPSGLLIKFRLFTVPGQVAHDSTRKSVLSRADAVVFVADSQRTQGVNNGEAFENLAHNAKVVGLDFEKLPLVVQFNKRDLPDALSEEEIRERWGAAPWPVHFATALSGEGVLETFSALLRPLYRSLDEACQLTGCHALSEEMFISAACKRSAASV